MSKQAIGNLGAALRKNEFSRLDIFFRGFQENSRGDEVRHRHTVSNLSDVLDLLIENQQDFKDSLVDIPETDSKKYQKIGIHKIEKIPGSRGVVFFHFQLGYVFRDKEPLEKCDIEDGSVNPIVLDGTEFRHMRLHFTIVPSYNTIVIDNKCHSGPTEQFLRAVLSEHIDPANYGVALGEALERTVVRITPVSKEDFDTVLTRRFRQLKEVELNIGKLSDMKLSGLPDETRETLDDESAEIAGVFESVFASLVGVNARDIAMQSLPIKNIRLSITLDEKSDNAPQRTQMRNNMRDFLRSYKDNIFLKEASFGYKDPETGELARALLNSAKLVEACPVEPQDYDNEELMWEAQRQVFNRLK